MKVNLIGLTDMTISFSGLGFVLRGKTVANNIDIKSDSQMRELIGMKNAKLINIEEIGEVKESISLDPSEVKIVLEEKKEDKTSDTVTKTAETAETTKTAKTAKTIKKISRKTESKEDEGSENVEDSDEVVIMVDGKARKGKSKKAMAGEPLDSEATRASIEALKQLEDEENEAKEAEKNRKEIDENLLPLNERMGQSATIAFGSKKSSSVQMKNSIIPEAEQIKNANNFIQSDEDKEIIKKEKERIKNVFIDTNDDNGDDGNKEGNGDDLIET